MTDRVPQLPREAVQRAYEALGARLDQSASDVANCEGWGFPDLREECSIVLLSVLSPRPCRDCGGTGERRGEYVKPGLCPNPAHIDGWEWVLTRDSGAGEN